MTLRSHSDVDKPQNNVDIALSEPVALTFSLKYLVNFCKASGLADSVKLCLSNEVPLLVEYGLQSGSHLRFYLAPKVRLAVVVYSVTLMLTVHFGRSATRSKGCTSADKKGDWLCPSSRGEMRGSMAAARLYYASMTSSTIFICCS